MPLPTPRQNENRAEFISRCVNDDVVQREFPDQQQRVAVCATQFEESRERGMSPNPNDQVLTAIRERGQKQTEFRYGILTADRYVRTLQDHVGSDACYRFATSKQTSFDDVLRKAAKTLVYSNPDMEVEEIEYSKQEGASIKKLGKIELPKNTLMVFRHTLTTPRKDRDGDILRTQGMEVDPKMLLLYQHVPTLPIGKMLQVARQNSKRLLVDSCIVDMNELCHDSAVMIDNDMGRFSHGFRTLEFEEFEEGGFDVKRAEIMEESLVSVPSNTDAETQEVMLSLVEGGKLTSPLMKEYGKTIRENRPVRVPVSLDVKLTVNGEEVSDENKSRSGSSEAGKAGEDSGSTPKETDDSAGEKKDSKDTEVKGFTGATGEFDGHLHRVKLDDDGNGTTAAAAGHSHRVVKFAVQESDGHKHGLSRGDLEKRGIDKLSEKQDEEEEESGIQFENTETKILDNSISEKAGRALSKANETRIRDAKEAIDDVLEMDNVPRPAKATLREAGQGLQSVLSENEAEEETPKQITVNDAMSVVLACANASQREKMLETLEVLKRVEQQNRKAKQYRGLVETN